MRMWPMLSFFLLAAPASFGADGSSTAIRVDQVGYPSGAIKLASVVTGEPAPRFTVNRVPGGDVVYEGRLTRAVRARDSGDRVRIADFTPVNTEGTFELRIEGVGRSAPFAIGASPYRDLLRLVTRSYYGQRCTTPVDLAPDHPEYNHAACHRVGGWHPSSGRTGERESTHGWHDAGDFGRYVVNSGISAGTLLWAWEMFPDAFRALDLAIPESGDEVPDLLDEIRWNLDWMLTMQDGDGGVWHKQTTVDFAALSVAPHEDTMTSVVIGTGSEPYKSSCATGELASTMAIAARVYAPFDASFASRTRQAAMRAWRWLGAHPDVPFRNPPGVLTGEYGDARCDDERLWAAAELWRTTQDPEFGRWFVAHASRAIKAIDHDDPPDWRDVGAFGAWSYALSGTGDAAVVSSIRRRSATAADTIVRRLRRHGYGVPLVEKNYVWGSNGVAANYAMQLLVADAIGPDTAYREGALEIVHYLLGRNPFALSWVTGTGTRSVMHPHHAPSEADGVEAPWPGLLAGGPNRNRQDEAMRGIPPGTPPAKMYLDLVPSYATNENAINWNAPLVFVLAGLSPERQRSGQ